MITLIPVTSVSILLARAEKFNTWLALPTVKLIFFVSFAACVWAGHAQTVEMLSSTYGAASEHMNLAFGAGTFTAALGFLAFPFSLGMVATQLMSFFAIAVSELRSDKYARRKQFAAVTALFLLTLVLGTCSIAPQLLFTSGVKEFFVDTIAYGSDLYDASKCDPDVKVGKIAFIDPKHERALVFIRHPLLSKRLAQYNKDDFKLMKPTLAGLLECKYTKYKM
ncbi:hypothetical protein [Paraburkholderia fynbosensis]|uniref:hypothetical protein n=1 Tax=Paraburkholderia fynbosensis TaxID=1200993 RepID=UPI001C2DF1B1|nr:hypothetical protein [Paraburkholderia fynbosensis]